MKVSLRALAMTGIALLVGVNSGSANPKDLDYRQENFQFTGVVFHARGCPSLANVELLGSRNAMPHAAASRPLLQVGRYPVTVAPVWTHGGPVMHSIDQLYVAFCAPGTAGTSRWEASYPDSDIPVGHRRIVRADIFLYDQRASQADAQVGHMDVTLFRGGVASVPILATGRPRECRPRAEVESPGRTRAPAVAGARAADDSSPDGFDTLSVESKRRKKVIKVVAHTKLAANAWPAVVAGPIEASPDGVAAVQSAVGAHQERTNKLQVDICVQNDKHYKLAAEYVAPQGSLIRTVFVSIPDGAAYPVVTLTLKPAAIVTPTVMESSCDKYLDLLQVTNSNGSATASVHVKTTAAAQIAGLELSSVGPLPAGEVAPQAWAATPAQHADVFVDICLNGGSTGIRKQVTAATNDLLWRIEVRIPPGANPAPVVTATTWLGGTVTVADVAGGGTCP